MAVERIEIEGIELIVKVSGRGLASARLIIRERQAKQGFNGRSRINRYLYLVYRAGDKIKEHYLAKLA